MILFKDLMNVLKAENIEIYLSEVHYNKETDKVVYTSFMSMLKEDTATYGEWIVYSFEIKNDIYGDKAVFIGVIEF